MFHKYILLLQVAITEMYPRIPLELVSDPLVFADHTLGTTGLGGCE
jgi:hypothetical protein